MRALKEAFTNMFGRRTAITAATAVLGIGLLGGAALAAFAPAPADTFSVVPGLEEAPSAEAANKGGDKHDRVKAVLDELVKKGVITQAQEDAILAALKEGEKRHDGTLRHVFANLFEQSVAYLGMTPADLKAKLPGTSLGKLASDAGGGKSRDGLVGSLTKSVFAALDKAVADNKITKEQAEKAKAEAPEHIAKFVDHVYPKKEPRPVTPKGPSVHAFIGDAVAAARDYLGMPAEEIMKALRSGKSLGEVASGAGGGKNREGLIAAITSAANAKIDKAQQDGKVTAEQATTLRAAVNAAVTQLVDRKENLVKAR